jgi:predicted dehydrogenase
MLSAMNRTKTIGIAIIGTGFARSTQIPGFRACPNAEIVAIASHHRENAERVAREFQIPHFTDDWRSLIARDDVDLVSIVTPPVTHREMTLAAFDAGKAVLCEKPMAMNAAEAREMADRAAKAGVLALIDHELRFLKGRQWARDLIQRGEIGTVTHAKLLFRADSRADGTRPWNWWSDESEGGGVLGAIGSHVIDGFRWFLGTDVSSVACNLATHVSERVDPATGKPRPVTADDEALLLLTFADGPNTKGATSAVSMSMVESGAPEHRLTVFGTEGALMLEDSGGLSRAERGSGKWERVETDPGDLAPGLRDSGWARGFTAFAREIVAAMTEGRTQIDGAATFEDGYRTQLALDAARESHRTGCRVTL